MRTDALGLPSYRALASYDVLETTYGEFILVYGSTTPEENQGRLERRLRDLRLVRQNGSILDFLNAPARILRARTPAVSTIALPFSGDCFFSMIDGNSPICTEPLSSFLERKFTWLHRRSALNAGTGGQGLFPALVERSFAFGVWTRQVGFEDGWLVSDCYAPATVCTVPLDRELLMPRLARHLTTPL